MKARELWSQLKLRFNEGSVMQLLLGYVVGAWAVLDILMTGTELAGLPLAVPRVFMWILLGGLFVVLWVALAKRGVQAMQRVRRPTTWERLRGWFGLLAIVLVLLPGSSVVRDGSLEWIMWRDAPLVALGSGALALVSTVAWRVSARLAARGAEASLLRVANVPGVPHLSSMTATRSRSALPRLTGEFITIGLGVLVALGVDEWRETQAEARQELEYYRSLVEDLDRDIAEYGFAREFIGVSIGAAEHVLAVITGAPSTNPYPTLVQSVQYASWVNYPAWSSGTLDELVNSGAIRLIRDQEIKRAMLSYYHGVAEWKPRLLGAEFGAYIEYRKVTAAWVYEGPSLWTTRRSSPVSDELADLGVVMEDSADGTRWRFRND
jgi:hypothetical protein